MLPFTEKGILRNPVLIGVPEAVKTKLPEPTFNVPAGVVNVIPFIVEVTIEA
jgi:hypothetical protein